ncbi:hypothetical protein PG990_004412 [Apiospora arundinis]
MSSSTHLHWNEQVSNFSEEQPEAVGPSVDAPAPHVPPPLPPSQRHALVHEPGKRPDQTGSAAEFILRPARPSSPLASGTTQKHHVRLQPQALTRDKSPVRESRQQQQQEGEPIGSSSRREADGHDTAQRVTEVPQLARRLPAMGMFKTRPGPGPAALPTRSDAERTAASFPEKGAPARKLLPFSRVRKDSGVAGLNPETKQKKGTTPKISRKRRQSQLVPVKEAGKRPGGEDVDPSAGPAPPKRRRRGTESTDEMPDDAMQRDDNNPILQLLKEQNKQYSSTRGRWTAINTTNHPRTISSSSSSLSSSSRKSSSRPSLHHQQRVAAGNNNLNGDDDDNNNNNNKTQSSPQQQDQERKTQQEKEEEEEQFYHDHAYRTLDYAAAPTTTGKKQRQRNGRAGSRKSGAVWRGFVEGLVHEDAEHNEKLAENLRRRRREREEQAAAQRRREKAEQRKADARERARVQREEKKKRNDEKKNKKEQEEEEMNSGDRAPDDDDAAHAAAAAAGATTAAVAT